LYPKAWAVWPGTVVHGSAEAVKWNTFTPFTTCGWMTWFPTPGVTAGNAVIEAWCMRAIWAALMVAIDPEPDVIEGIESVLEDGLVEARSVASIPRSLWPGTGHQAR
jgi:hypothetical protein